MKIRLVAYGIAREIIDAREKSWEAGPVKNIHDLKTKLVEDYPAFSKLAKLSFAVGEEYREDDFILNEGDEVVIIPPVSGG